MRDAIEDALRSAETILNEPCLHSHSERGCGNAKHWTIGQLDSRRVARAFIAGHRLLVLAAGGQAPQRREVLLLALGNSMDE